MLKIKAFNLCFICALFLLSVVAIETSKEDSAKDSKKNVLVDKLDGGRKPVDIEPFDSNKSVGLENKTWEERSWEDEVKLTTQKADEAAQKANEAMLKAVEAIMKEKEATQKAKEAEHKAKEANQKEAKKMAKEAKEAKQKAMEAEQKATEAKQKAIEARRKALLTRRKAIAVMQWARKAKQKESGKKNIK